MPPGSFRSLFCQFVEGKLYKAADMGLVVGVAASQMPVGNGAADGAGLVSEMAGKACDGGDQEGGNNAD